MQPGSQGQVFATGLGNVRLYDIRADSEQFYILISTKKRDKLLSDSLIFWRFTQIWWVRLCLKNYARMFGCIL